MAGAALDGELTAARGRSGTGGTPTPPHGLRFALATLADDAAIRRLLRASPMRGAVSVAFEREPDYFAGEGLAGAADRTLLAFDHGQIVSMGRCSARAAFLNGEPHRVGYLAELRLDATASGRFDILRQGYRALRELEAAEPADFYFTSIAADNQRARQLLERGVPGLPRYDFLAEFVTLLIPVGRSASQSRASLGLAQRPVTDRPYVPQLESATPGELVAFLNAAARRHQLAAVWSEETLAALARHALPAERFQVWRRGGEIIAAAALWDQRGFRQTVIRGYARSLAWLRPLLNLTGARLPPPGATLAHAFLSPLAVEAAGEALLPDFVAAFFPLAARGGIEFLSLGLPADDSRLDLLRRRFRCREYRSRLYRVGLAASGAEPDGRPFLPEVALL